MEPSQLHGNIPGKHIDINCHVHCLLLLPVKSAIKQHYLSLKAQVVTHSMGRKASVVDRHRMLWLAARASAQTSIGKP